MDSDYKELRNRYDQIQEENENQRKTHFTAQKKYNEDLEKFKKQLYGTIRRIQYLIQEKQKLQKELKNQGSYISKLEYKIVRENLNVKGLKQKVKLLTQQDYPGSLQATNRGFESFQKQQQILIGQSQQGQGVNPQDLSNEHGNELEELDVLIAEQELQNLLDQPDNKIDRQAIQSIIDKQKLTEEFTNQDLLPQEEQFDHFDQQVDEEPDYEEDFEN